MSTQMLGAAKPGHEANHGEPHQSLAKKLENSSSDILEQVISRAQCP